MINIDNDEMFGDDDYIVEDERGNIYEVVNGDNAARGNPTIIDPNLVPEDISQPHVEIQLTDFGYKYCVRFFPDEKQPAVIDIHKIRKFRVDYTKKFRDREITTFRYEERVDQLVFKIKDIRKVILGYNLEKFEYFAELNMDIEDAVAILVALNEPGKFICIYDKVIEFSTIRTPEDDELLTFSPKPEDFCDDTLKNPEYESESDEDDFRNIWENEYSTHEFTKYKNFPTLGPNSTAYDIVEFYSPIQQDERRHTLYAIDEAGGIYLLRFGIRFVPQWKKCNIPTKSQFPYLMILKNLKFDEKLKLYINDVRSDVNLLSKILRSTPQRVIKIYYDKRRIPIKKMREFIDLKRLEYGLKLFTRNILYMPRYEYHN
jgi:hypothetical protein